MTAEVKIPETNTNWRSVDIYLFSNGQQFSPPRKYHLHSDELTWWKPTLMHLARMHYGSLHSNIELYTLDGHKVEGPLELINGNTYVAVEPPDLFIDSGYNKYMMKASRSWEKSQARKMISIEVIKSVVSDECNNNILISKSDNVTDSVPIKIENENPTDEMVQIHDIESVNTVKKRPLACTDNNSLKSFAPLIKTTENNRQSCSLNPPVITKLLNSATLLPKKRSLGITKDHVPKTNSKVQDMQKNVSNSSKNKVPIIKKETSTPYKFKTPVSLPSKVKKMSNDSSKRLSKPGLTKPVKNTIAATNYVQTEASIFKNTDSELLSTLLVLKDDCHRNETDEKQIHSDLKEKCDIFRAIPEEILDVGKINALKEPITTYADDHKTSSKIFIDSTDQMNHEPNVTFSDKKIEENCILINKGDIINLKLHIEVQKKENVTKSYNILVKRSKSLTNIFKHEKASQINLDDEIHVQNKIQSNTLHSLLISELNQNTSANESSNLVIIKCDCCTNCNYDLANLDALLSQNVNKNYILLMPTAKYNEPLQRCQCEHEDNGEFKTIVDNKEQVKSTSIYSPLKKAIADLSLERLSSTEPEILIKITDQETSEAANKSHCEKNANNSENNEYEQNENLFTKFNEIKTEDYEKAKFIITKKATEVQLKTALDKSIQTECSNILLQARRQDDGHYTFHLPPLHLLKYYKIY